MLRAIVRRVIVRLFAGSLPESLAVAGNGLLTVVILESLEFFAGICKDLGVAKISETGLEAAVFFSVAEPLEIETLPSDALSEIRTSPGGVALTPPMLTIVQHTVSKRPGSKWCIKCFGIALPAETA